MASRPSPHEKWQWRLRPGAQTGRAAWVLPHGGVDLALSLLWWGEQAREALPWSWEREAQWAGDIPLPSPAAKSLV